MYVCMADIQYLCQDFAIATVAQLAHHRSAVVRAELCCMLEEMHRQYRVCGQFSMPTSAFATYPRSN